MLIPNLTWSNLGKTKQYYRFSVVLEKTKINSRMDRSWKKRNVIHYLDDVDTLDEDDTDDDVDTELDVDALKRKTSVSENILYKSIMLEIHKWFPNSIPQKVFKLNLTQLQWGESRLGITKNKNTILFLITSMKLRYLTMSILTTM